MNIKEKFLQLTDRTYPHGTEQDLFPLLSSELQADEFGNLFIKIGESDVMFTSHLDTATSAMASITHVIEENIIKTDNKTILGADDKAGVTIMLHMIENKIPGLYYFFLGEEVGCVGSKKVSGKQATEKIEGITKVISFDRRGTKSVITFQASSRCCSDKFGEALAKELNEKGVGFEYKNDPTGIYTDSAQFTKIYPECTNISVGYQNEHCFSEQQDIDHLDRLAQACLLVDWTSLPVERDPSVSEYSWGGGYGAYGYDWDDEYAYGGYGAGYKPKSTYTPPTYEPIKRSDKSWFHDNKFNYLSSFDVTKAGKILSADLCEERVLFETQIIEDLLRALELDFTRITWDGFTLVVNYRTPGHSSTSDRNDLLEYLPELDYRSNDEQNEKYVGKKYLDDDLYD